MGFIGIAILLIFACAAYVIFMYSEKSDSQRAQIRARISSRWRKVRLDSRKRFNSEELNRSLRQAGMKMSAVTYTYIRLVFTLLAVLYAVRGWVMFHSVTGAGVAIIVYLLFEYRSPFPMYFGFKALRQNHLNKLNRQLYLLFALIRQQLHIHRNHPKSLYDLLEASMPRVPQLSRAIERCLVKWTNSPKDALEAFALEVGTPEAGELTELLYEVEVGQAENVLDMLEVSHLSFQEKRVALFQQRLQIRSYVSTVLVTLGLVGVAFNFMVLTEMYSRSLLKF